MGLIDRLRVIRVSGSAERTLAIEVMRATYQQEKNWITRDEKLFPDDELGNDQVSWFVVLEENRPIGTLRVLYDLPLDTYKEYGFKNLGGVDIDEFIRRNRIAEIGRFAVLPEYRKHMVVVGALMRAASLETILRGFSHYVTDIFEGETHNPYNFHTRVLGFIPVATHDTGELNCPNRRITLILELRAAYQRLRKHGGWLYRFFTEGWPPHLHQLLDAPAPAPAAASATPAQTPSSTPAPAA